MFPYFLGLVMIFSVLISEGGPQKFVVRIGPSVPKAVEASVCYMLRTNSSVTERCGSASCLVSGGLAVTV